MLLRARPTMMATSQLTLGRQGKRGEVLCQVLAGTSRLASLRGRAKRRSRDVL